MLHITIYTWPDFNTCVHKQIFIYRVFQKKLSHYTTVEQILIIECYFQLNSNFKSVSFFWEILYMLNIWQMTQGKETFDRLHICKLIPFEECEAFHHCLLKCRPCFISCGRLFNVLGVPHTSPFHFIVSFL